MPAPRESRRFTDEQMNNARAIISVGRSLGATDRDLLIALMTAFQESGLRNLNYGDRDSIGLFQQRNAWGSRADRLDPVKAARMFFLGGAQGQRGLLDFKQRTQWSLTQAAQKVQVSAYPDAYAKHENRARALLSELGTSLAYQGPASIPVDSSLQASTGESAVLADLGDQQQQQTQTEAAGVEAATAPGIEAGDVAPGGATAPGIEAGDQAPDYSGTMDFLPVSAPPGSPDAQTFSSLFPQQGITNGARARVIQFAKGLLGTPYVFGGNDPNTGLDCSSFTQLALQQVGVYLPRISAAQARYGKRTDINALRPGDLIAWDNSTRNNGADHIAIYMGNGQIIEEPRPGLGVRIRQLGNNEGAWGVQLDY